MSVKIRNEYVKKGVDGFYRENASTYENPHEAIIHSHLIHLERNGFIKNTSLLDLCCGTGQVSNFLKKRGYRKISGCDPYTNLEYTKRTGLKAFNFDFMKISCGALKGQKYDYVICSFALHLCPISILPNVLYALSEVAEKLIVISPHKKPEINQYWEEEHRFVSERVTTRVFKNNVFNQKEVG